MRRTVRQAALAAIASAVLAACVVVPDQPAPGVGSAPLPAGSASPAGRPSPPAGGPTARPATPDATAGTLALRGVGGLPCLEQEEWCHRDGAIAQAYLDGIYDLVARPDGSFVILGADTLRTFADGQVTTLIGRGNDGFDLKPGRGLEAGLDSPRAIAVDADGTAYVTDKNCIVKVTPDGEASLYAGDPATFDTPFEGPNAGGIAIESLAIDEDGALYWAMQGDYSTQVYKLPRGGEPELLAGTTEFDPKAPKLREGPGAQAIFAGEELVYDGAGALFLADDLGGRLLRVDLRDPDHRVTVVAGSGERGPIDGPGKEAAFRRLWALAIDGAGQIFVTDIWKDYRDAPGTNDHFCIRKVDTRDPAYPVTTLDLAERRSDLDWSPGALAVGADGKLFVSNEAPRRAQDLDVLE